MSLEKASDADSDVEVYAFGQKLLMKTDPNSCDAPRRLSELTEIYERALASRSLPKKGVALDIGAGSGWFAVPFAKAFPDWTVIAFEPDAREFEFLKANTLVYELNNVRFVNATFHPDVQMAEQQSEDVFGALVDADFVPIVGLAPRFAPDGGDHANPEAITLPVLTTEVLTRLSPTLIKIDAPFLEAEIARTLRTVPVSFIVGRLYDYVPSSAFAPAPGAEPREYYLTHREHVLRRDYEDNFPERRPGLDIVIAMYNAKDYIVECLESLLEDGNPDIRLLVVDDGSNDGGGQLVANRFDASDRVVLLTKANGGCASARNFGRLQSDATHIAFVDADDRVDSDLFTALLEVSRYTGAYVSEGEFAFLEIDDDGRENLKPSYEDEQYQQAGSHRVEDFGFTWINGRNICYGQPTIWRRVYRRDFLDTKNVWFPEHVRAFDDQIFQFLVGMYCGAIAHVRGVCYHYRQHAAQDIKQGDERHFYSFNMFRSILMRAIKEGWQDFDPIFQALLNTMRWSYSGLRDDLKDLYRDSAVRFLAIVSKTLNYSFSSEELQSTRIDGLRLLLNIRLQSMGDAPANYGYSQLDDWRWQPEFIRMAVRAKKLGKS